jgi:hypothetical protein
VLAALYFIETDRYGLHYIFSALAMSCKEDVPLIVAMLGVYLLLAKRQWKHGALTIAFGASWFAVDAFLILPAFSDANPLLMSRYSAYGDSVGEALVYIVTHPVEALGYLVTPQRLRYVLSLLSPLVFLSVFGPEALVLALPTLAVNLLSSFGSQHAVDVFHYSAPAVPGLIAGAVCGVRHLSRGLARLSRLGRRMWVASAAAILLLFSGASLYTRGALPVFGFFDWPEPGVHTAIGHRVLDHVPETASVSAQAMLVPHLTHRPVIYQFPVIRDAEYVVVDVSSRSVWPIADYDAYYGNVRDLLEGGEFGIRAAEDGYLLLSRGVGDSKLPESFYSFLRPDVLKADHDVDVQFGGADGLRLVGYSVEARRDNGYRLELLLQPVEPGFEGAEVLVAFLDADGRLLDTRCFPALRWIRPSDWAGGDLIRLDSGYLGRLPKQDFELGMWVVGYPPTILGGAPEVEPAAGPRIWLSSDGQQLSLRSYDQVDPHLFRDVTLSRAPTAVPLMARSLDANLGGKVSLAAYELSQTKYRAGDQVVLDLYWRSHAEFSDDLTVFSHLVDSGGQLLSQHDKQPLDGRYPTSWWAEGDIIRDTYTLSIPDSVASEEELTIFAGMYELESGVRVATSGEDAAIDARIRVASIVVH